MIESNSVAMMAQCGQTSAFSAVDVNPLKRRITGTEKYLIRE